MKKTLLSAAVLALLVAGCATSSEVSQGGGVMAGDSDQATGAGQSESTMPAAHHGGGVSLPREVIYSPNPLVRQ